MPVEYAVALVHYHLNGGGATRIIEQQANALTEIGIPHIIFCGEKNTSSKIPHHLIPELHFSNKYDKAASDDIRENILKTLSIHFPSTKVIFHFHNHSIGLNPHYEDIVYQLASSFPMLLQIHDFVEDGRSHNLPNIRIFNHLYPTGSHIHYCNINSRDRNILRSAGTSSTLLPNSFREVPRRPCPPSHWIFYPVQALRRKNIGELLLLSLATPDPYKFAIGTTPTDQPEIAAYWSSIVKELNLPIAFDVTDKLTPVEGASASFSSWYEHANRIVTTSIQEGFGMAYIEPIYFEKSLFGRDLPEITQDIKQEGVVHPNLYLRIEIQLPQYYVHDFGKLSDSEQTGLLKTLSMNPSLMACVKVITANQTLNLNSFIEKILRDQTTLPVSSINPWSIKNLKVNLEQLYTKLLNSEITPLSNLDHQEIRRFFLKNRHQ